MTSASVSSSHLDRVLLLVGCPGRYHLLVAFLLCCMQYPISFSNHLLPFYTLTPKHRCRAETNLTLGDYDLRPVVIINGKRQYSQCELYVDALDHLKGTRPCDDGWEFLQKAGESSVVTEWELVCERQSMANSLPYLTTVAAMIGALTMGILADKYGRKYVLLLSLLVHSTFGVFLHFLPLFGVFATVFSAQSLLIAGVQSTTYLLLLENLPTAWHSKAALAIIVFQCSGQMMLAILAWLIRHWRYIQLVISAPGLIVIGYFWLLPRSLAWLVLENRQHSAQLTLARFSKEPTLPVTPGLRMQLIKSCRVALSMPCGYAARHGFENIICSARLRKLAFIQFYIWFVISLTSNCAVEDIAAIKNNIFSRLFVNGVMEMSAAVLLYIAINSIGLKTVQGTSLSVAGICCIFSAIVSHQIIQMRFKFVLQRGLNNFAPVFALLGQSITRASNITLWLHAVKTFPTGVRGLGIGSCLFFAEVAKMFAPSIEELGIHSRFTVLAISGTLCVIAGLLTFLLLPDCTERPLATIAEEVEINQTKIISDSDLDFRDTSSTSGFIPNITLEDSDDQSHSSASFNESGSISFSLLRRLADIVQRKTQTFLKPRFSVDTLPKLNTHKNLPPISVVMGGDVFEPVTGFVFKWNKAEPTVTLSEFEKEMSAYWTPNNDPSEKKLNDKHLNSLNILYNIDQDNPVLDIQNSEDQLIDSEHGNDSSL